MKQLQITLTKGIDFEFIRTKILKKTIKIALVAYSLSKGGLERVVSNQSKMFTEMGYEVHIYVLNSDIDYNYSGRLHRFEINKLSFFNKLRKYIELKRSLQKEQFDFIIDNRYRLNFLSEIFWQKYIYHRQKLINYIHSSNYKNYIFKSEILNKFLFKKSLFICVSKVLEQTVHHLLPNLSTKTVYNAIQINSEKQSLSCCRSYFLAIGRMDCNNIKQIDLLIECYAKSQLPKLNFDLMILGDGSRLEEMKNLTKVLGLENCIHFKGFVENPYPYLENAYCTVLTSKYEGFGMVLAESLMCGTPVVSFDCKSGPNEIIEDGINGLLIENQNRNEFIKGINRIATDKMLYENLKVNTKKSVEKFSLERIRKEWKTILENY